MKTKFLGIIAVVAIMGFGFIACDDGSSPTAATGDPVAVTGVTVAPETLALTVGGNPGTLTVTIEPANATNKAVTWSTSDSTVATVSGGGSYAIGDTGPAGGIVFYNKGSISDGWRYLEAAPNRFDDLDWASPPHIPGM